MGIRSGRLWKCRLNAILHEVLDDEAPEINYVPLGFSKSCEDIPVLENAIAIDNCLGEVDITVETDTVFGCPQTYTMTRTFTDR